LKSKILPVLYSCSLWHYQSGTQTIYKYFV